MELENEQSREKSLLSLEHEVEILREQLESLKQELLEERQRAEDYREELIYTQLELEELDRELLNYITLDKLQISEAIKDNVDDLNSEVGSSSSLNLPFKLYSSTESITSSDLRKKLLMQLKSERTRLRSQFKELSQNLLMFKAYSNELIENMRVKLTENSSDSE